MAKKQQDSKRKRSLPLQKEDTKSKSDDGKCKSPTGQCVNSRACNLEDKCIYNRK